MPGFSGVSVTCCRNTEYFHFANLLRLIAVQVSAGDICDEERAVHIECGVGASSCVDAPVDGTVGVEAVYMPVGAGVDKAVLSDGESAAAFEPVHG